MQQALDFATAKKTADHYGLVIRGGFRVLKEDKVPDSPGGEQALSMILFGNAGSSIWPAFSGSGEYHDGEPDPLDRWSKRIGEQLAAQWQGTAWFPFGGPPFQPFLQWAKKAEQLESSRLGMLIHPQYGLWHAYRFAIALPFGLSWLANDQAATPIACNTCADQPCLSTCPVSAFTAEGYDVKGCFRYLDETPEAACHASGCQARRACPQGVQFRYHSDHAAFHMAKFFESLTTRFKS